MPRKRAAPAVDPAIVANAVDALGRLQTQLSELKNREAELKDRILAAGDTEINGALFRAKVVTQTRWTLDVAAAKAALGKDWVASNSNLATIRLLRIIPRTDVIAAAAAGLA